MEMDVGSRALDFRGRTKLQGRAQDLQAAFNFLYTHDHSIRAVVTACGSQFKMSHDLATQTASSACKTAMACAGFPFRLQACIFNLHAALAGKHEDPHIPIVRAEGTAGFCAKRGEEVMTKATPVLAVSSDPNLPAIEGKIQSADDYPCHREDGCRDVRINQLIQVMEQEPILVRLGSGLGFKPVLQHGQRTRPRQLRKYPPDERSDMQAAKNRS
jgi:hypothetical protein